MLLGCEEELDRIISTGRNDSTEKALSAPETIQKNSFLVMNYWYRYWNLRLKTGLEIPQMSKEDIYIYIYVNVIVG